MSQINAVSHLNKIHDVVEHSKNKQKRGSTFITVCGREFTHLEVRYPSSDNEKVPSGYVYCSECGCEEIAEL